MSVTGTGSIFLKQSFVTAIGALAPGSTSFQNPMTPNLVDFLTFLNNSVGISSTYLPASSLFPGYALAQAIALVLLPPMAPGILYTLAVYNCATHLLFMITPDQQGQTYFKDARSNNVAQPGGAPGGFALFQPSTGLVEATHDEVTGSSYANPDWVKGLTVSQLGFYKTPWGREYLAWQQSYGPTIIGLT